MVGVHSCLVNFTTSDRKGKEKETDSIGFYIKYWKVLKLSLQV